MFFFSFFSLEMKAEEEELNVNDTFQINRILFLFCFKEIFVVSCFMSLNLKLKYEWETLGFT